MVCVPVADRWDPQNSVVGIAPPDLLECQRHAWGNAYLAAEPARERAARHPQTTGALRDRPAHCFQIRLRGYSRDGKRRYLGIEDSLGAQRFPFNSTEDFAFLG